MDISGLISVIVVLVIVGVGLWLIETYVPLAAPIKVVIRIVVVLFLVLWLLSAFGLWHGMASTRMVR